MRIITVTSLLTIIAAYLILATVANAGTCTTICSGSGANTFCTTTCD